MDVSIKQQYFEKKSVQSNAINNSKTLQVSSATKNSGNKEDALCGNEDPPGNNEVLDGDDVTDEHGSDLEQSGQNAQPDQSLMCRKMRSIKPKLKKKKCELEIVV